MKILILILSAAVLIALVMGFKAMATSYEEPAYEVVEEAEAGYRYHFIMPSEYTLETLPTPEDPTVSLRQVAAKTVAVHRYSGRWTQERYRQHEAKLLEALKAAGFHHALRSPEFLLARLQEDHPPEFDLERANSLAFRSLVHSDARRLSFSETICCG